MGQLTRVPIAVSLIVATVAAPVFAESDTLLQAIGFALTGSDDAKVQTIDRANCVFRIENKMFHLNNIQVDRLVIRKSGPPPPLPLTADDPTARAIREATSGRHVDPKVDPTLVVELHGSGPVYESTDIFRDAGFDVPGPPLSSNEYTIELTTSESDRVSRAWQYIFSHGCVGQKSPF
jgi:hypothetical protein